MQIQLIRHATLMLKLGGKSLLVDPMFSPAAAWDPVRNSANPQRNPMEELPWAASELTIALERLDAVFVTHLHADHWDEPAKQQLSKDLPVFCQPHDADAIEQEGFTQVRAVETDLDWEGLRLTLTAGRHGTGEVADRIGPVSGFVIGAEGEPSLYVAGDTVWCPALEQELDRHRPAVVVVNAGAAQFLDSDPITMTAEGVVQVARAAPQAQIVAVHMETINHCGLTRAALAEELRLQQLDQQVWIPADGQQRTY